MDVVRCLLWIWVCSYHSSCKEVNVALNKKTSTASGVYSNWYPSGAVDGDHDTLNSASSCFHSNTSQADWTVDLGQEYQLYSISVYIRKDYNYRTANSIIYVDNDPSRVCYTFPSTISDNPTRLTCNETARYVTIKNPGDNGYNDSLNICEVEIYACTGGYRGVDCDVDCHCDECDRWTGNCNSTCTPGWEGQRCDRACIGTYGLNCTKSCDARQCSNSFSSCDPVNGTCDSGCLAGWTGHDCISECPSSTYGLNCSVNCTDRHCMDNSTCHHVTGSCDLGCESGWKSIDCTKECVEGEEFGPNCAGSCNARHCLNQTSCDPTTGLCDFGCEAGWEGSQCLQAVLNVALNKKTSTKSGVYMDWSPSGAVDGDHDTLNSSSSCFASATSPADWTVDLGQEYQLYRISVYIREGFLYRTADSTIYVDNNSSRVCYTFPSTISDNPTRLTCNETARYVTIRNPGMGDGDDDSLNICEVEIYAITEATTDTEGDPSPGTGVGVIAGAAAAGVLVVLVLVLLTVLLIRRKNRKATDRSSDSKQLNQTHVTKDRAQEDNIYENFALEEKTEETRESKKELGNHEVQSMNDVPAQYVSAHGKKGKYLQELENNGTETTGADENKYYNLGQVDSKHVILLSQLPQKLKEMKENPSVIKDEYETLLQDFLYSYEESQKKENKSKNRFRGFYPYDYNRVVLRDSEDETDGDYINASYIDGYKADKRFIAAQGPYKTELFEDFWRMIWQEGCTAIVMVTSLVEDGKMKCLQYWPEKGTENYGRLTVTTESRIQLADYTITNLVVQHCQHSKKRHIKHFYYTSWSDHDVPDISGLLTFMRRVQNVTKGQQHPIVVHCSAGIGRTGTYIAVESLVNQATTEGVVDVVSFVTTMRGQRRNMVQTEEQYHFIYKAVSHAVTYGDTSLRVDVIKHLDLDQIAHFTMGNKTVEKHLQILQKVKTDGVPHTGYTVLPSYRKRCEFILMTSQPDGDEIWNLIFNGDVRILITDSTCKELFSSDSAVTFTKGREVLLFEDVTMCSVALTSQDGERTVQIEYYQVRGDLNEGTLSVLADSLLQGTGQAEGQATAVVSRSERECGVLALLVNLVNSLQDEGGADIINEFTRLQQRLPNVTFYVDHVRRCLEFVKRWIESTETYANV